MGWAYMRNKTAIDTAGRIVSNMIKISTNIRKLESNKKCTHLTVFPEEHRALVMSNRTKPVKRPNTESKSGKLSINTNQQKN